MRRVLILPIFALVFTMLMMFPHNASASPHMSVAVTGGIDPGTIVTISGSGFSSSDTFITIKGGMDAHFIATPDSTPCLLTNGAFSCNYFAFPSGGGDATQNLEAVGNTGDYAVDFSFIYGFHQGLAAYPSQASVGTTVTVYGSGYLGDLVIKNVPIGDQDLKVFFNNGLVAEGIEPSFHLITPGSTTTCYPTDGSLDDNGPCTFVVPPVDPGTYTITATAYSFGAQTKSFSVPFTVITPSVDASPPEATKGSTVTLTGSNFAGLDTSGKILWRGADVTPSSGCRFFNLYQTGNFFQCMITVPTSDLASAGPNFVTVVGDKMGDYASAKVDIPGNYPLSVSSSQASIGSTITVSGEAFPPSDTFVTLTIGSQPGNSGPTCPLTNGAFSCSFTISTNAPVGSVQVFAQGNNGGQDDFDFADIKIGPGISLLQSSGSVGTTIQVNGAGFSFGSTLTMKFDGQSLPFTDLSFGGEFGTAPSQQDPVCHVESLFFTCFLTIPPTTSGSHTITITDGSSNSASTILQVNPSVSVAPPTSQFGISSTSNLLMSQSQGTTRTIVSVNAFGLSSSETAAHVMFGNFFVGFANGCPVVSGSFTCPFIVPTSLPPGPYPLQVIDNNGNTLSAGTFTVTSPLTGILNTLQFPAGTMVSVNAFGLKSSDTSATMTFNGQNVGPPSGCQVSGGSIASSCTFTIPSGMSSGIYNLQVTGNSGGTVLVTIAVLPAISISPQSAQSGSTTSVSLSGSGFASTDTSAKISLGSMVLGNCPVNSGSLSCSSSFAVPSNLTASVYPVTAVGDKQGDTGLTTFGLTGVAMITIGQQNNLIGISQSGFSPYDKSFSVIFNGQTIQTCYNVGAIFSGLASPPSSCQFNVPRINAGFYPVKVEGNTGDFTISTFQVEPSISSIPGQGPVGTAISVNGFNFASSDTSATITFNGTDVTPSSGCQISGGTIPFSSCSFTVPSTKWGSYNILAIGSSGDVATTTFAVEPSVTLTPSQGPTGTQVAVDGNNFAPTDTSATLTFNGKSIGTPSGCQVSGGSIVSPCTIIIPTGLAPGTYYLVTTGNADASCSFGGGCDQEFTPFTVQAPTVSVSPSSSPIGSPVSVSGSGFSPIDTSATLTFSLSPYGQVDVSPSGGCQVSGGSIVSSSCTFTVPSKLSGGAVLDSNALAPYTVTVTGNTGDSGTTSFNAQITFSVTPTVVSQGKDITVSGAGYACIGGGSIIPCSNISFFAFNANTFTPLLLTPSFCPLTDGAFSCSVTIPIDAPQGNYTFEGSTSFSNPTASITIPLPPFTASPAGGKIGSSVTISGGSFASSDTSATLTFSQSPNGQVDVSPSGGCPIVGGTIPSCTFTVPSKLSGGYVVDSFFVHAYNITATGTSGDQFTTSFFALPSFTMTSSVVLPGHTVTVSGTGYACLDSSNNVVPCQSVSLTATNLNTDNNISITPTSCPLTDDSFSCSVTIPADAPQGSYIFVATAPSFSSGDTQFTIPIPDTVPPVIAPIPDQTIEASSSAGAAATFTATATDDTDGTDPVTCNPASGSTFVIGSTVITCNSQDNSGNKATPAAFIITVQDTTPPMLALPSGITQETTSPSGNVVTYSASANDLVDGSVVPQCTPSSGSTFAVGTTIVNCSATDAHGNKATGSFNVKIQDTTPPSITTSDITKEAIGPIGDAVTFTVSATDIVDGTDPVTCNPASGSVFAIGATTVTCTSTNKAGNTGTSTFNVIIQDTTPPTLTLPSDITKEATGQLTPVTFTVSATDIVDGTDPVTCNPASGSTFSLGTTPVSCTSTDAHGNKASGTFNVTIQDTTPAALVIQSPPNNDIVNTATVTVFGTASDNVQVSKVTWKVDNGPVSTATGTTVWSFTTGTLSTGAHTIYVTATDEAGLVTTSSTNITYVAPTETLPSPSGGTKPITFTTGSGGFTSLTSIPSSSLPTPPPPGNYPLGFFSWDITGFAPSKSVTVTITSPTTLHTQSHYFKLVGGTWVSIPVSVHGNTITFTISDNGPFDGNPTVGVISDPGAVVNPTDGKVTGGGNIGKDVDFSFEARSDIDKTGITHGTLEYHDKSGNIKLHSNRVSFLSVDPAVSQATFSGTGDLANKHNYIFIVSITDSDKTGNHDTFTITITDNTGKVVYQNTGTVKGHIEIHKFSDKDDKSDSGVQHGNNGNQNGNDKGHNNSK